MKQGQPESSTEREFDVVVFGATGFTGGLVAEYLLDHEGVDVSRWALAGRDRVKLTEVRAGLSKRDPRAKELALVVADSSDPASLRDMAARTRVVLTTVGPYARYGEPLVAACVEQGTHYVDLTGEPLWWKEMIARYDAAAREKKLKLVSCCGFDSIPHDLGALFTLDAFDPPLGSDATVHIDAYVAAKGSVSGGTWASALNHFGEMRKRGSTSSNKSSSSGSGSRSKARGPHRARDIGGKWAVPMPTIDPMVVRRSAKLRDDGVANFSYHHYMSLKDTKMMVGLLGGVGAVVALSQFGPARRALEKLKPSGAGPTEAERARNWFKVTFVARGQGEGRARKVVTQVAGGDPGYGATSKMIAESALCLAFDTERLPQVFGFITPAAAMGRPLIERLKRAEMSFQVLERD